MKRKMKFRVWMKDTSFMFDWHDIVTHGWKWADVNINGLVTMQFIGLLDRNGKEIYEGDIVITPSGETTVDDPILGDWIYIEIKECKWGAEQLEVIGNVYENPELLKGNK